MVHAGLEVGTRLSTLESAIEGGAVADFHDKYNEDGTATVSTFELSQLYVW